MKTIDYEMPYRLKKTGCLFSVHSYEVARKNELLSRIVVIERKIFIFDNNPKILIFHYRLHKFHLPNYNIFITKLIFLNP
jgi:hypothetical protein